MNLPHCDVCGQYLICQTDSFSMIEVNGKKVMGYGRMTFTHPKPCIPLPPPEPDEPDEFQTTPRICEECKKPFFPLKASRVQVVCNDRCRKARRDKQKRESEARRGRHWIKRAA